MALVRVRNSAGVVFDVEESIQQGFDLELVADETPLTETSPEPAPARDSTPASGRSAATAAPTETEGA